jgi:hypothetical protein
MSTGGKIAVGAAVVIGGIVVYKLVSQQNAVASVARTTNTTPTQTTVNGFLNLATSLTNYFTKQPPSPMAVTGSKSWDSTSDLYLPAAPGQAYANDTTHDDLLA